MSTLFPPQSDCTIAVIGLGYVGLPLAVEFALSRECVKSRTITSRKVIGFDIDEKRVSQLRGGLDRTNEVSTHQLQQASELTLTSNINDLIHADVFIITVPTPIDSAKRPDFRPLENASSTVGEVLRMRSQAPDKYLPIVIYESTVYPGATEEVCVPILEKTSGLLYNHQFVCGYSPERINPGDHRHTLTSITKVTSGSTPKAAHWINDLYGSIITAGTHLAPSIEVAEAAKVIENTQRDLNIALINELAIIFNKLEIDTLDVLEAAGSKWNFLPFRPGLVGGHCIGVDPYYLTHRAEQVGYHPEVVLAGRRINDRMGEWMAEQIVLRLAQERIAIGSSTILIMGLTFKENCPDLRNTKVVDIIRTLNKFCISTVVSDPWAEFDEALSEYNVELSSSKIEDIECDAIVVAVAHEQFERMSLESWSALCKDKLVFDIKGIVPRQLNPIRL